MRLLPSLAIFLPKSNMASNSQSFIYFKEKIEKSKTIFALLSDLSYSHKLPSKLDRIKGPEFVKHYKRLMLISNFQRKGENPIITLETSDEWRSVDIQLSTIEELVEIHKKFPPPPYSDDLFGIRQSLQPITLYFRKA